MPEDSYILHSQEQRSEGMDSFGALKHLPSLIGFEPIS